MQHMSLPADFYVRNRRPCWVLGIALSIVCVSGVGCRRSIQLDSVYGQRRGDGVRSVNGTLVLAEMFEQAGHQVSRLAASVAQARQGPSDRLGT